MQCQANFYPRSPCGERPVEIVIVIMHALISIHALLAESDSNISKTSQYSMYFYPRSPCGERLMLIIGTLRSTHISIHALLAESDRPATGRPTRRPHFYPRSPCGERQSIGTLRTVNVTFLSTLSLRRATYAKETPPLTLPISIHALLAESDTWLFIPPTPTSHFYPRSPCGERRLGFI